MEFCEILEKLCRVPGVSGNESEIASVILSMIEEDCDTRVDALGNIIAEKKGDHPASEKIVLDAHMDEVGLIIRNISEDGTLRFSTVGAIDPRVLIGRQVSAGEEELPGVIGGKPVHLQDADERKNPVPADKLYIDLGCSGREQAEALVRKGDTVSFLPEFSRFGEAAWRGKALDSRFGCAILIDLIHSQLPCDCTFVFSVQGQTGGVGASAAGFSIQPDIAVVLDAAPAGDLPGISEKDRSCALGKGAVLSFMDKGTFYARPLWEKALELAEKNKIPVQIKTAGSPKSNGFSYQKAGAGAQVLSVCAPCRYVHSPQCVMQEEDIKAVRDLIYAFLCEF